MMQEEANSAMNEDKQIGMRAWIAASPVRSSPPRAPHPSTMSSNTNKDMCTNLTQQMNLANPCQASGGLPKANRAFLPAFIWAKWLKPPSQNLPEWFV